ncbi:MAG: condensation domain-containing protein, partial [Phycisphaerales bacterium]|nr:condensation domain-containing protein [Phycisphaerales bacterium]
NDLLLAALVRALGKLLGEHEVAILLEGHGRESLQEDIDISKTMGWFTSILPVVLPIIGKNIEETIIAVKEALRAIPNKGIGYGFLKGYKQLPKFSFNYLGVFNKEDKEDWFLSSEASGISVSQNNKNGLWLDINGGVTASGQLAFFVRGKLGMKWMNDFATSFKQALEIVVDTTLVMNRSYLTPSDTQYLVRQDLLDKLQETQEIEAIYWANSWQAGLIYHYLNKTADDGAYKVQLQWRYHTAVNENYFMQAWQLALNHYPGLRVRFNWDHELIQIIDKKAVLDYRFRDIQKLKNKEAAIEAIRIEDRKEDYDLTKGNLLRVYLIQLKKEEFVVLYSSHHAITDGWSNPNLWGYVHAMYADLMHGKEQGIFLEDQAYLRAQEYLQVACRKPNAWLFDYLQGIDRRLDVSAWCKPSAKGIDILSYKITEDLLMKRISLSGVIYQSLERLINREGLTWSNLMMWAWSKVLCMYDHKKEHVVGLMVSGRGLPIEDIEQSVGLYINLLPLVIRHDSSASILSILKTIQKDTIMLNQRSYSFDVLNLFEVKDLQRSLSNVVVYQNYPRLKQEHDGDAGFHLTPVFDWARDFYHYPLHLIASENAGTLDIALQYAGELFEDEKIEEVLQRLVWLLKQIPAHCHEGESIL